MPIVFKYIEKIQQKPEHVRKRIAFFITIGLFFAVVFLWLFLDNLNVISKEYAKDDINTPSPFVNIKDTVGSIFDDVKKKTEGVEDYFDIQ